MRTGRNSIGIDIKKEYVNLGLKRLKEKLKQRTLAINDKNDIELLRGVDIKNKIISIEKSKVFNKEDYIKKHLGMVV